MTTCPLCGDEAPTLYVARGEECCASCARVHAGWDDTEESASLIGIHERADAVATFSTRETPAGGEKTT